MAARDLSPRLHAEFDHGDLILKSSFDGQTEWAITLYGAEIDAVADFIATDRGPYGPSEDMSAADVHNVLGREFVHRAGRETRDEDELIVVIESALLGAMLIMQRRDGMKPEAAVGMAEAALQRSIERFAEARKGSAA